MSHRQGRVSTARLDTTFDIATPEGVELQLPVAGLAPRALAWLIDFLIKFVIFFALQLVAQFMGELGEGFLYLNLFAVLWLYNVLFEIFMNGATPGKRVLGLRVVNADGTPVGWSGAVVRNLIRPVDALPSVYTIGLLSVLLTKNMQRLGDLAANTVVVFTTPIDQFEFEKSLMQEHFNENYLESEKYPEATFSAQIENWTGSTGQQMVTVLGDLTIHGVTKKVSIEGELQYAADKVEVSAVFPVLLKDYKIKIPRAVFYNIAEEVEVTVNFTYEPYEAE